MTMSMISKLVRSRRGQGLVEYALIIAGVALICAAGISLFGHKTGDMIDAVAVVLPGAHTDDNGPIAQGELIATTGSGSGPITLDLSTMQSGGNTLGQNVVSGTTTNGLNGLIVDPVSATGR